MSGKELRSSTVVRQLFSESYGVSQQEWIAHFFFQFRMKWHKMKLCGSKFKIRNSCGFIQCEVKLWNSLPEVDVDAESFLGLGGRVTHQWRRWL